MNYRSCLLTSGVSVMQFCANTSPSLSFSLSLTHSHTRIFQHGGGQGDAGQRSLHKLTALPATIGDLNLLVELNVSENVLTSLPPELVSV